MLNMDLHSAVSGNLASMIVKIFLERYPPTDGDAPHGKSTVLPKSSKFTMALQKQLAYFFITITSSYSSNPGHLQYVYLPTIQSYTFGGPPTHLNSPGRTLVKGRILVQCKKMLLVTYCHISKASAFSVIFQFVFITKSYKITSQHIIELFSNKTLCFCTTSCHQLLFSRLFQLLCFSFSTFLLLLSKEYSTKQASDKFFRVHPFHDILILALSLCSCCFFNYYQ